MSVKPDRVYWFPAWPPARLMRAATLAWNLRNPEAQCDSDQSDWGFVCNVCHCYLRHALTDYDAVVTSETREALQEAIRSCARRAYPWLREDCDPRSSTESLGQPQARPTKFFDIVSHRLSDLITLRAELLKATSELRYKRALPDYAERLSFLNGHLKSIEEAIGNFTERAMPIDPKTGFRFLHFDRIPEDEGRYWWLGLKLSESYTRAINVQCPRCQKRVYETKSRVNCGSSIRLKIFSCGCMTVAVSHGWMDTKWWRTFLYDKEQPTSESA